MRTITIGEFERHWEAVFDEVERGETVRLTCDGREILEVLPGNGSLVTEQP